MPTENYTLQKGRFAKIAAIGETCNLVNLIYFPIFTRKCHLYTFVLLDSVE